MTKIAIMQPYFFPYIGYFQGIHAVEKYILYDNLNFIKEQWVHRNRILITREPRYFGLNLAQKSSFKKIRETELVTNPSWRRKNLKTLFLSYKSSAYFDEIYPVLEALMMYETNSLSEFNSNVIIQIAAMLGISTEIIPNSSDYVEIEEKLSDMDSLHALRQKYKLTEYTTKVLRILEICSLENATTFVNAIGGQSLYDKNEFQQNGIQLLFVNTHDYTYNQDSSKFHPHLSIIDVLFHCGVEGTKKMIQNYTLI
jgi:hypothetical protein